MKLESKLDAWDSSGASSVTGLGAGFFVFIGSKRQTPFETALLTPKINILFRVFIPEAAGMEKD